MLHNSLFSFNFDCCKQFIKQVFHLGIHLPTTFWSANIQLQFFGYGFIAFKVFKLNFFNLNLLLWLTHNNIDKWNNHNNLKICNNHTNHTYDNNYNNQNKHNAQSNYAGQSFEFSIPSLLLRLFVSILGLLYSSLKRCKVVHARVSDNLTITIITL
jgi:hypothetical protein